MQCLYRVLFVLKVFLNIVLKLLRQKVAVTLSITPIKNIKLNNLASIYTI